MDGGIKVSNLGEAPSSCPICKSAYLSDKHQNTCIAKHHQINLPTPKAVSAEKIAKEIVNLVARSVGSLSVFALQVNIAEQIKLAQEEAKRDAIIEFCEGDTSKAAEIEQAAYAKGFSDGQVEMRERAAKVAEDFEAVNSGQYGREIADRIRQLKSP